MKFFCILLLALPLLCHGYPSEEKAISLEDSDQVESESEQQIQKRSGSFDLVTHLKSGLLSGLGRASASIASGSSGGSSGNSYKSVESGHHGNSVEFDPWSLKKSVLNTIFQAVKAITGGVTALKGQLIKGSGYALSAGGKLVAASGDKVTDVGKSIINSAQLSPSVPSYAHSGGPTHPFAKFSSLSGASSSGSGGGGGGNHHAAVPVVHQETITSYEIPSDHHSNYGPPSKPPTYSSATHQYLPPAGGGYSGGAAPFSAHAAFEAPSNNYLPSSYGLPSNDGHDDDFNVYGRHTKLTEQEARKAAVALQEILAMLPSPSTGKTEFTATKTVTASNFHTDPSGSGKIHPEHVDLIAYGLPSHLGQLESVSHTESITAAYAPPPSSHSSYSQQTLVNSPSPSDVYRQMAHKQQQHVGVPHTQYVQEEGYKYTHPHSEGGSDHIADNLTPILAALEATAHNKNHVVKTHYTVQKNVNNYASDPVTTHNGYKYAAPAESNTAHDYPKAPATTQELPNYELPPAAYSSHTFNTASAQDVHSYELSPAADSSHTYNTAPAQNVHSYELPPHAGSSQTYNTAPAQDVHSYELPPSVDSSNTYNTAPAQEIHSYKLQTAHDYPKSPVTTQELPNYKLQPAAVNSHTYNTAPAQDVHSYELPPLADGSHTYNTAPAQDVHNYKLPPVADSSHTYNTAPTQDVQGYELPLGTHHSNPFYTTGSGQSKKPSQHGTHHHFQPTSVVNKSKYTYFNPSAVQNKGDFPYRPHYSTSVKTRRQIVHKNKSRPPRSHSYEIDDPLMFNRMLMAF